MGRGRPAQDQKGLTMIDAVVARAAKTSGTPHNPAGGFNGFEFIPGQTSKSFATLSNLQKAIRDRGFENIRHVVFQQADGRWTVIFTGQDANPVIFAGFCWFG